MTRAQGTSVLYVSATDAEATDAEEEVLWLGNQWQTSRFPGKPRNHDLLYFAKLDFAANGSVAPLVWHDSVRLG